MSTAPLQSTAFLRSTLTALAAVLASLALDDGAAQEIQATVEAQGGFVIPIYDDEDRKVTEIRYDSAKARANEGIADLTDLEIHIFGDPDKPDSSWIIRAPNCSFHQSNNTAESDGVVTLSTQDDSVSIRGKGFAWSQTTETLKILQHEKTAIRLERQNDNAQIESRNLTIESKSFEYHFATGAARYLNDVIASIPEVFSLSAPRCSVVFRKNDSELRSVSAEGGTTLKVWREGREFEATAHSARLRNPNSENEQIEMSQDFRWETLEIRGSGERGIVMGQSATLQVVNNARLEVLESDASSVSSVITSDTYELTKDQVIFSGSVLLKRPTETMRCETMTGEIDSEGRLDRLVARRAEVTLALERSGRPVLAQANELELNDLHAQTPRISLRDNASWRSNGLVGAGDEILYDPKTEQLRVIGSARAEYRQPDGNNEKPLTITSQSYSLSPEFAIFEGDPLLTSPDWTWSVNQLTLYPRGNWDAFDRAEGIGASRIHRETNARPVTTPDGLSIENFDLQSANATIRLNDDTSIRDISAKGAVRLRSEGRLGLGDQATFDANQGIARLLGNPTLTHPNGLETIGSEETIVEYDLNDGAVNILGPYQTIIPNQTLRRSANTSGETKGARD